MLPPRRAPFGRRAVQPPPGATTLTAPSSDPHWRTSGGCTHLRLLREESRDSSVVVRATRAGPCALPHTWGTCLACYRAGTELRIVAAQACGAVCGPTGTNHLGWYACPRLTLFATEWSAAGG